MSRKTRKLMWSVPLIAAVAVIGALAAFVMLTPNGALAHDPGANTAPHVPPDPVTGIGVTTPTVANGGRTSLMVSWNAPADGDPVEEYRVDYSTDARVWHNVIGGEEAGKGTLTEDMAMSNCGSDADADDRCYTVDMLMPGTTYHFRVFAMNEFGTSPISVDETIATGETRPVSPPDAITGLTATDYFTDRIVLNWNAPVDDGGADVLWYCITMAASPSGAFLDLTDETNNGAACLTAANATSTTVDISLLVDNDTTNDGGATGTPARTIVISATDDDDNPVTTYTHDDLDAEGLPDSFSLRYRLYAVTEDAGDNRRISLAASNTATGGTLAPPSTAPPQSRAPEAPRNVKVVAYGGTLTEAGEADDTTDDTLSGPVMNFYWNTPGNFPTGMGTDFRSWTVEVQRVVPNDDNTGSEYQAVVGTVQTPPGATDNPGTAPAQFSVDLTDGDAPVLIGATPSSGQFRVRYVNPGPDLDGDATNGHANDNPNDDVAGAWAYINISLPLDGNDHISTTIAESTLPIITKAATNGTPTDLTAVEGLRFTRNPHDAKRRIDLRWMRDVNANTVESRQRPTGYVIDRSDDGGVTWQAMHRATQPADLGTATTYTDSADVAPGTRYTYRVFPVYITSGIAHQDDFGLPGQIHASSEEADVPARVENLRTSSDGQTAIKLEWDPLPASKNGGHPVLGYLVQHAATDVDNNKLLSNAPGWANFGTNADGTADNDDDYITVGADTTEFTYRPDDGATPPVPTLSAGNVRWFRVIAITAENDGLVTTGGNQVVIGTGALALDSPSTGETNPTVEDTQIAVPKYGMTESLPDPGRDDSPELSEMPMDLTAEAAFDSNTLSDGGRGVFLTWNEVEDPDTATLSYKIERMRMNTGVDALNDTEWEFIARTTGDTSYTDSLPLRQDTETRMYRVGSEATGQTEVVWVEMAVMYALHPGMHMPSAPQMVEAMSDSATEVTVSWMTPADDGGSDITGFTVRWKLSSAADYAMDDMMMVAADADSYQVTGLMAGMSYDFQVIATNAEDDSYPSMADTAMTMPGMPQMVEASPDSATQITVSWMAPAGGSATGYMVQSAYEMSDGTMSTWMDVDPAHMGTDMMYVHMGLMPNTKYYYRVAAMNASGMGEYSDGMAYAMTHTGILTAPVLTATPGTGSVMLDWDDQDSAVDYTVWGVRPDGSAVREGSTSPLIRMDNITDTSYTVMDLMSGQEYWFVVTACEMADCDAGKYLHSNFVRATPN